MLYCTIFLLVDIFFSSLLRLSVYFLCVFLFKLCTKTEEVEWNHMYTEQRAMKKKKRSIVRSTSSRQRVNCCECVWRQMLDISIVYMISLLIFFSCSSVFFFFLFMWSNRSAQIYVMNATTFYMLLFHTFRFFVFLFVSDEYPPNNIYIFFLNPKCDKWNGWDRVEFEKSHINWFSAILFSSLSSFRFVCVKP